MKLGWKEILALGGLLFAGVVIYRISKLQAPAVTDVGKVVADTAAEVIALPKTIADSLGAGTMGSALGDAAFAITHPSTDVQMSVSMEQAKWQGGMVTWLVGQGATRSEALTVVSAWRPGMAAPTMVNVQRLRNGDAPFSWFAKLGAK